MPIFNGGKYFATSVDSILAQTCADFELILVNDGSTDDTSDLCEAYAARDTRIKIIHLKENRGAATARNIGMEAARGRYISFIDSDDHLVPEGLAYMRRAMEETGTGLVIGRALRTNTVLSNPLTALRYQVQSQQHLIEQMHGSSSFDWNFTTVWGKLFDRNLLQDLYFPDQKFSEDYCLMCEVSLRSTTFTWVDNPLYHYINSPDAITRQPFSTHSLDTVQSYLRHYEDFKRRQLATYSGLCLGKAFKALLHTRARNRASLALKSVEDFLAKSARHYYPDLLRAKGIPLLTKMLLSLLLICPQLYLLARKSAPTRGVRS